MSVYDTCKDGESINSFKEKGHWYWHIIRQYPQENGKIHGPFANETMALYDAQDKAKMRPVVGFSSDNEN